MITITCSFVVLGALTYALALSVYGRKKNERLTQNQKHHLWFAAVCVFMGVVVPCGVLLQAMFSGDSSMSAPEAVYEYARIKGDFSDEQMRTISAGVRYAHAHYWGSSGYEVVYLLYPVSFILLAVLHWRFVFEGVLKDQSTEPNKSVQTTAMTPPPSITPQAPSSDL